MNTDTEIPASGHGQVSDHHDNENCGGGNNQNNVHLSAGSKETQGQAGSGDQPMDTGEEYTTGVSDNLEDNTSISKFKTKHPASLEAIEQSEGATIRIEASNLGQMQQAFITENRQEIAPQEETTTQNLSTEGVEDIDANRSNVDTTGIQARGPTAAQSLSNTDQVDTNLHQTYNDLSRTSTANSSLQHVARENNDVEDSTEETQNHFGETGSSRIASSSPDVDAIATHIRMANLETEHTNTSFEAERENMTPQPDTPNLAQDEKIVKPIPKKRGRLKKQQKRLKQKPSSSGTNRTSSSNINSRDSDDILTNQDQAATKSATPRKKKKIPPMEPFVVEQLYALSRKRYDQLQRRKSGLPLSPRTAEACLAEGVDPRDLTHVPQDYFAKGSSRTTPHSVSSSAIDVGLMRWQAYEKRREKRLQDVQRGRDELVMDDKRTNWMSAISNKITHDVDANELRLYRIEDAAANELEDLEKLARIELNKFDNLLKEQKERRKQKMVARKKEKQVEHTKQAGDYSIQSQAKANEESEKIAQHRKHRAEEMARQKERLVKKQVEAKHERAEQLLQKQEDDRREAFELAAARRELKLKEIDRQKRREEQRRARKLAVWEQVKNEDNEGVQEELNEERERMKAEQIEKAKIAEKRRRRVQERAALVKQNKEEELQQKLAEGEEKARKMQEKLERMREQEAEYKRQQHERRLQTKMMVEEQDYQRRQEIADRINIENMITHQMKLNKESELEIMRERAKLEEEERQEKREQVQRKEEYRRAQEYLRVSQKTDRTNAIVEAKKTSVKRKQDIAKHAQVLREKIIRMGDELKLHGGTTSPKKLRQAKAELKMLIESSKHSLMQYTTLGSAERSSTMDAPGMMSMDKDNPSTKDLQAFLGSPPKKIETSEKRRHLPQLKSPSSQLQQKKRKQKRINNAPEKCMDSSPEFRENFTTDTAPRNRSKYNSVELLQLPKTPTTSSSARNEGQTPDWHPDYNSQQERPPFEQIRMEALAHIGDASSKPGTGTADSRQASQWAMSSVENKSTFDSSLYEETSKRVSEYLSRSRGSSEY